MIKLLMSGVCFVLFIVLEICFLVLRKNSRQYESSKERRNAIVVSYDSSEKSRWYSLIVKLIDDIDDKTYICNSSKINISEYPIGTVVDVIVAKKKFLGIQYKELFLVDAMPPSEKSMSSVFGVVGLVLLAIAFFIVISYLCY